MKYAYYQKAYIAIAQASLSANVNNLGIYYSEFHELESKVLISLVFKIYSC